MSDQTGNYQFYNIADDLTITLRDTAKGVSTDKFVKGNFVNDDLSLLISTQDRDNSKFNVFKIDVEKYTFEIVKDQTGNADNIIDFYLFDSQTNRFLTLELGQAGTWKIQLRNLNDLTIIDTFLLDAHFFTDFEVKDTKLISSLDWGTKFAIAAQNKAAI